MRKILVALLFLLCFLTPGLLAATYTVINTSDDGNAGCLRWAIQQANANPGADTIAFNIPTADPNYITEGNVSYWRIRPGSALPAIAGADGDYTIIDGSTQTTNQGDKNPYGPEIMVDGTSAGAGAIGLDVVSSNCLIKNLIISNFTSDGVYFEFGTYNHIYGCYIGTDPTATSAAGNFRGITVRRTVGTVIGSTESTNKNIISGNDADGIFIGRLDRPASSTEVLGNYIGVDRTGTADLGNAWFGIWIREGASYNKIGNASGAGNVISGNEWRGITIQGEGSEPDPFSGYNEILGNYIGTDATGLSDLGNASGGISINSGAHHNYIGNGSAGGRNIISGNDDNGLEFGDSDTNSNEALGNYIGLNSPGSQAIANSGAGISIGGDSSYNRIGNGSAGGRNVISGNSADGISVNDNLTRNNEINNNYIGTDSTSSSFISNTRHGVNLESSTSTLVNNCRIFSSSQNGINVINASSNCSILGNVVRGQGNGYGILMGIGGLEIGGNGNLISTNEVINFSTGIITSLLAGNTLTIDKNTLVGNLTGVDLSSTSANTVNITNSIVCYSPDNSSPGSSSGIVQSPTSLTTANISYCDVYGNGTNYSNLTPSAGTIEADAKFVDAANNDYHLSSSSPCINTGTPAGTDMGAYPYLGDPAIIIKMDGTAIINNDYIAAQPQIIAYLTDTAPLNAATVKMYLDATEVAPTITTITSRSLEALYQVTSPLSPESVMQHSITVEVTNINSQTSTKEIHGLKVTGSSAQPAIQGQVTVYPQKFSPSNAESCSVAYSLNTDTPVTIYLVSPVGQIEWTQKITAGANGAKTGYNTVTFNGVSDISGTYLGNGIYPIKITTNGKVLGTAYVVVFE